MRDLPRIVAETPAGKDVKIEVWRDGSTKTLHAEIAKQKSKEEVATAEPTAPSPGSAGTEVPALGATVAPATPDLQQRFGLPGNASGVVIVDLAPDGPAAKQGLMPGDVIEQVSQRPVKTPADVERLAEAARQSDQKSLLLLVNRQGDNLYVALKLAEV
jgi:serine protease Do